jgi:hypothetical protein
VEPREHAVRAAGTYFRWDVSALVWTDGRPSLFSDGCAYATVRLRAWWARHTTRAAFTARDHTVMPPRFLPRGTLRQTYRSCYATVARQLPHTSTRTGSEIATPQYRLFALAVHAVCGAMRDHRGDAFYRGCRLCLR